MLFFMFAHLAAYCFANPYGPQVQRFFLLLYPYISIFTADLILTLIKQGNLKRVLGMCAFIFIVIIGETSYIGSLGEGIGDFKSGKEIYNFSLPQGKFGVLICFESSSPTFVENLSKTEPISWSRLQTMPGSEEPPLPINTLALLHSGQWRIESSLPGQPIQESQASSTLEERFLKQGGIFTEEAINGMIRLSKDKTFYTLYGDVFAWCSSAFSIFLLAYALFQKSKNMR
jgi:hypothetical protein